MNCLNRVQSHHCGSPIEYGTVDKAPIKSRPVVDVTAETVSTQIAKGIRARFDRSRRKKRIMLSFTLLIQSSFLVLTTKYKPPAKTAVKVRARRFSRSMS